MSTLTHPKHQDEGLLEGLGYRVVGKSFVPESHELVKAIRVELCHIDDQIRHHVFLSNLREGKVSLHGLQAFTGHQYHMMETGLRSTAMMIHRFSKPSVQSYFVQEFQGAVESQKNLMHLARKLGMNEEQLRLYPLMPEAFAYATYMSWLSTYASAAEIVAGYLLNFEVWGFNCGQMSQSLKDQYRFVQEDTVFLDAYAKMPSVEPVELQIIQEGLNQGIDAAQIHRVTSLLQGYEKMFWDAMADQGNM